MESMSFTPGERDELLKDSQAVHIHSRISFLNAHNGLRRGSVHVTLGTPGGGKSTLVRTLIRDFLFNKDNASYQCGVWLSEETCQEYKVQMMYGMPPCDALDRGFLVSEEEHLGQPVEYFLKHLEMMSPDVIVYDNITTSRFYEGASIKEQDELFRKIKTITKKLNCATIIIAHTKAEITENTEKLISMNDIRGSKSIINGSEFVYILQRFEISDGVFYPTIRIVKHRGQELIHSMYFLKYEKSIRAFTEDLPITFDKFKEAFSLRKRL